MEEGGRERVRERKEAKGGGGGDSGKQPLGERAVRVILPERSMVTSSVAPLLPLLTPTHHHHPLYSTLHGLAITSHHPQPHTPPARNKP
ncbi:hypothetical protein E2C01_024554 [Portunus trituberculatus]|uniref:Uncharacterized protein n=1 Tax=Portunus trituberculatus TaxID=210409 RepID=A0A5B7ED52_PORTR|nr:hypothetical protein [Portunus trituberculatus]